MDEIQKPNDCEQCESDLFLEAKALRRLNEASSRLWRTNCLSTGLEEIVIATIGLLGGSLGSVQLSNQATGKLTVATQRGCGPEFLESFREVCVGDNSACGRALRSGRRVIIEDVELDPLFAPYLSNARKAGFRAVQATPIVGRDGIVLGIISTYFKDPHRPSQVDLECLDLYALQASDFVERCHREEELRQRAEEREALLDALPAFIWFGDAESGVIQGNRAAKQMMAAAQRVVSEDANGQSPPLRELKRDGAECRPGGIAHPNSDRQR